MRELKPLDTERVFYLLTENCKSRRSCVGCDMSGKQSLKDTCLLYTLKHLVDGKQSTLQTRFEQQIKDNSAVLGFDER